MSLDQNLFTLNFFSRTDDPSVIELTDPVGTVHYRKELSGDQGTLYKFDLIDPLSESALATISSPGASSKLKTIELHNPSVPVELKYTGTFTFRWTFHWGEHEFEWKREECYLIRKPDPPVMVAIAKEPPGKIKTKAVQILDYNLGRFDIHDRKGLDIVLLSALLTFQDFNDASRGPKREESSSSIPVQESSGKSRAVSDPTPPPELPPKPKRSGPEKIAAMQKGELNDVVVETEGEINAYAAYCANLLEGDNMLFITLRSSSAETVPKVLQILHEAKRIRHKNGSEEDLHQYVRYDNQQSPSVGRKGPRVIKLDDDNGASGYKPPESLTVWLSKIPMPELSPPKPKKPTSPGGREQTTPDRESPTNQKALAKELKRIEKDEERQRREREKLRKSKDKGKDSVRARSLDRPELNQHRHSSSAGQSSSHRSKESQAKPSPPTVKMTLRPPNASRPGARPVSAYGAMPAFSHPPYPPSPQQPSNTPNGLFDRLRRW